MPKSAKRQKLTKEELKAENQRLRNENAANSNQAETSKRIMELLSKENWIAYLGCAFLPPFGIWYVWKKRNKHHLNNAQMLVWTMIAIIITIRWIQQIVTWVSA